MSVLTADSCRHGKSARPCAPSSGCLPSYAKVAQHTSGWCQLNWIARLLHNCLARLFSVFFFSGHTSARRTSPPARVDPQPQMGGGQAADILHFPAPPRPDGLRASSTSPASSSSSVRSSSATNVSGAEIARELTRTTRELLSLDATHGLRSSPSLPERHAVVDGVRIADYQRGLEYLATVMLALDEQRRQDEHIDGSSTPGTGSSFRLLARALNHVAFGPTKPDQFPVAIHLIWHWRCANISYVLVSTIQSVCIRISCKWSKTRAFPL